MTVPNRVRLAPAGGNGRPLAVAALIVAVLAFGVLKPWGGEPQPGPAPVAAGRPTAPTAATPAPVGVAAAGPAASSGDGGPCSWGLAWRLFTAETTDIGPVRTWYGLQPLEASGPTDPRIEVVRIHSTSIGELGYCSISRPGPTHILGTQAWRLRPGGSAQPVLLAPEPGAAPSDPDTGVIYGPPALLASSLPSTGAWPLATYVFGIHLATKPGSEEWFAVQIL
ncbi:MAG TPA: hypothetical protein VID26_04005 [Candidatus Limnocylindrales bacterium]|jgi:hypothetical protein